MKGTRIPVSLILNELAVDIVSRKLVINMLRWFVRTSLTHRICFSATKERVEILP
ncbi:antitoxin [Mesotoga sp.]|uniref:antitoxin n=1 Tax=Mesotoga sp. TaxID=2053577 RepID=UPI00345EDE0D